METKPKRETVPPFEIDGFVWSDWTLILTPHKHDLWFTGDLEGTKAASMRQISRTTLPTSYAGVYEIAIEPPFGEETRKICIYVGRARDAGSQGNNLRNRIGRYMKSGFDLANELRYFLDANCCVYARWARFKQGEQTDKAERLLLDKFDYAFNTQYNTAYRAVDFVLWDSKTTLCHKLQPAKTESKSDSESSTEELFVRILDELSESQQSRLLLKLKIKLGV